MSAKFELTAEPRTGQGKGASRRLRRDGKVPAVMYGAGKPPVMLSLDHNAMLRNLDIEKFHTSILTVSVDGAADQAILRDYQMHPFKPLVMHVDLQRISATEKIHMRVPLHFLNQDIAPGVKQQGGVVMHLMAEVDVTCLPKDLPEFLPVDLAKMNLNDSLHLKDIPLPEGVTITSLTHGGDNLAIVSITMPRAIEEEAPAAEAAAEAAAAPAEAGKAEAGKPEAGKAEAGKKEAGKAEAGKKEAAKPETAAKPAKK
jgi:large subunit ribosomal protein L25